MILESTKFNSKSVYYDLFVVFLEFKHRKGKIKIVTR